MARLRVLWTITPVLPGAELKVESPGQFIPVPDGWEERSRLIRTIGNAMFFSVHPLGAQ